MERYNKYNRINESKMITTTNCELLIVLDRNKYTNYIMRNKNYAPIGLNEWHLLVFTNNGKKIEQNFLTAL